VRRKNGKELAFNIAEWRKVLMWLTPNI